MKCPNCNKRLKIDEGVLRNVETYQQSQISVANCCGYGVSIYPNMKYIVEPYTGSNKIDNWGKPMKTNKL